MKKLLILLLALALALSLAACDIQGAVEGAMQSAIGNALGGSGSTASGSGSGLTQGDIGDADDAWAKLENFFYAEDWRWDEEDGSGYINGKWDEGVMYDPVPAPPDGLEVDEMQYIGKKSRKWSDSGNIGDMYIDGTDYEYISVSFGCSKAQLEAMVKSYEAAGWIMHFEEDYGNGDMWHFYYGKDYYAYLRAAEYMASGSNELGAYLTITPAYYALPATVAGVRMPQCGILFGEGWLQGYDSDYNFIEEDIPVNTPASALPAKWLFANERYYGVVASDLKAYRDEMVADGWTLASEYEEGDSYNIMLTKGDVRVQCAAYGGYYMSIQLSNDENLYY